MRGPTVITVRWAEGEGAKVRRRMSSAAASSSSSSISWLDHSVSYPVAVLWSYILTVLLAYRP